MRPSVEKPIIIRNVSLLFSQNWMDGEEGKKKDLSGAGAQCRSFFVAR